MADDDTQNNNSLPQQNKQDVQMELDTGTGMSNSDTSKIEQVATEGGNAVYNSSKDILSGAYFKKYDYPQHLEGIQEQYSVTAGGNKILNFKQDYIVLIRKKLFYAANAQMNMVSQNGDSAGQIGDGHYVRTYTVNNFTSIRTSIGVAGSMGNCQVEIQGAERVFCYEEDSSNNNASSMTVDNPTDSANSTAKDTLNLPDGFGVGTPYISNFNASAVQTNTTIVSMAKKYGMNFWNGNMGNASSAQQKDGSSLGGATFVTKKNDDGVTGTVTVTQPDGKVYDLILPLVYTQSVSTDGNKNDGLADNTQVVGWKFAEKCDWEPMDEVWIYGKSNFERDKRTGDFKMNQIFFGYIDSVTKTHSAGKTAGCTISISASDQLKLLDLSYVTMNPSLTPGASGSNGLDLRYSAQDHKHFGTFKIFNPYAVAQSLANQDVEGATPEQQEALNSSWRNLTLTEVFAGMPVCWIIKKLCLDAGVPTWYLADRIEDIQFPPFVYQIKQTNSGMLFTATMKKRLQECNEAAQKLMLEFFADEEGNIVLKCPNYALGVNAKVKNNMGLEQLAGGLISNMEIDDMKPYYLSPSDLPKEDDKTVDNTQTNIKTMVSTKNVDSNGIKRQLTPEYSQYLYAKAGATVIEQNGGDVAKAAKMMDGYQMTDKVATDIANKKSNLETTLPYESSTDDDGNVTNVYYNTDEYNLDILHAKADKAGKYLESSDNVANKNETVDSNTNATGQENTAKVKYTTDYYMSTVRKGGYAVPLSEYTDALIPEIPQEFILQFSLTDSDKQIYNMYEVNIEGNFGVYDGSGPLTQIRRVFPDIPSMIRFGCRPYPQAINFPAMGNRENAHLLGFMKVATSLAKRNSATINMIEDSYIKVGNPIRFFSYDEHPDTPLYPQTDKNSLGSTLNYMSLNGNTKGLQEVTNDFLNPIKQEIDTAKDDKAKQISEDGSQKEVSQTTETNDSTNTDVDTEGATQDSSTSDDGSYEDIENGSSLNQTSYQGSANTAYSGTLASTAAMYTNAQSVYYVEQISRNINISGQSTMTLTLTCGRMMGRPSCIDQMLLLYKAYFNPLLGYCPDIATITKIKKKYDGNTDTYTISAADTLITIAIGYYNIDVSPAQNSPADTEVSDELKENPYSTYVLQNTNEWDKKTFKNGWKILTGVVTGKIYQVASNGKGKVVHTFKYYIYDGDDTAWIYLKDGEWDSANTVQGGCISYKDHAQRELQMLTQEAAMNHATNCTFRNSANFEAQGNASDIGTSTPPQITDAQLQTNELKNAIIALNVEMFGNSLEITIKQFDEILHDNFGSTITIPKSLVMGDGDTTEDNAGSSGNGYSAGTKQDADLTDDEASTYGSDATKTTSTDSMGVTTNSISSADGTLSNVEKISDSGIKLESTNTQILDDSSKTVSYTKRTMDIDGNNCYTGYTKVYDNNGEFVPSQSKLFIAKESESGTMGESTYYCDNKNVSQDVLLNAVKTSSISDINSTFGNLSGSTGVSRDYSIGTSSTRLENYNNSTKYTTTL